MPLTLNNIAEEQLYVEYLAARRGIQNRIGQGVYPNVAATLRDFAVFQDALAEGGRFEMFGGYYQEQLVESGTGQYVADMLAILAQLKAKVEEIEDTYPGTFSIVRDS